MRLDLLVISPFCRQHKYMSPVVRNVITSNMWATISSYAFTLSWALLSGFKRVAADPRNHGQRITFLIVSMTLSGLNCICNGHPFGTGIRPVWFWVESELNPAEAPSGHDLVSPLGLLKNIVGRTWGRYKSALR